MARQRGTDDQSRRCDHTGQGYGEQGHSGSGLHAHKLALLPVNDLYAVSTLGALPHRVRTALALRRRQRALRCDWSSIRCSVRVDERNDRLRNCPPPTAIVVL